MIDSRRYMPHTVKCMSTVHAALKKQFRGSDSTVVMCLYSILLLFKDICLHTCSCGIKRLVTIGRLKMRLQNLLSSILKQTETHWSLKPALHLLVIVKSDSFVHLIDIMRRCFSFPCGARWGETDESSQINMQEKTWLMSILYNLFFTPSMFSLCSHFQLFACRRSLQRPPTTSWTADLNCCWLLDIWTNSLMTLDLWCWEWPSVF